MTNVHFDGDEEAIKMLFEDFTMEDQWRTVNKRTGTRSIVYVLFATVADKIRAAQLSGVTLLDREIKIQPAHNGNYKLNDSDTGFVKPEKRKQKAKDTAPAHTQDDDLPSFVDSDFPELTTPSAKETPMKLPETPVVDEPNTPAPTISPTMGLVKDLASMVLNSGQHQDTAEDAAGDDRSIGQHEAAPLGAATARHIHENEQATNPDRGPFTRPRGPPLGVDMSHLPYDANWNLDGHDENDKTKNVITPNMWYNFEAAQAAKAEKEGGTNVGRILEHQETDEEQDRNSR